MELTKGKVILIVALVLGMFLSVSCIALYVSTRNRGYTLENALSRQWNDTQARYGQFRLTITDQLGIARENQAAIRQLLASAVTGRYDSEAEGVVDHGSLLSAVEEAYPNLKGLDLYEKIIVSIQAGRERFGKDQEKLNDMVRAYNHWLTTGESYHPLVVRLVGFPSQSLKAQVGEVVYTGPEALDKMSTAITGSDSRRIFESGKDEGISNNH